MEDFNNLDSYQSPDTSVPRPARIHLRIIAFILDFVLIASLTIVALGRFILPYYYPDAMGQLHTLINDYIAGAKFVDTALSIPAPIQHMLVFAQGFTLIVWWIYFSAMEIFSQGASLGKKVFKLRAVQCNTTEPLSVFGYILRNAFKSMILLTYFPLMVINTVFMFFNASRRAGHDYLCRSMVIEDN